MAAQTTYAISMGDLVHSSGHDDPNALHRLFNEVVAEANRRYAESIVSPLTITLGDEFQGLSASLVRGFELNHFVRLRLLGRGVSTRLVLGAGAIDTAVNPDNAWNMMGEGLSRAREKLNAKLRFNCYRFSFPCEAQLERLLDGIGRSLTNIESGWTSTQRDYVIKRLSQPQHSVSVIAAELGISKNSMYKVLRAADADFYEAQLESISESLAHEDERRGA